MAKSLTASLLTFCVVVTADVSSNLNNYVLRQDPTFDKKKVDESSRANAKRPRKKKSKLLANAVPIDANVPK